MQSIENFAKSGATMCRTLLKLFHATILKLINVVEGCDYLQPIRSETQITVVPQNSFGSVRFSTHIPLSAQRLRVFTAYFSLLSVIHV